MFEYYNNNPTCKIHKRGKNKGKKEIKTDCVIRAMQQYFGLSWKDTARKLAERSIELGETQTSRKTYESFLQASGINVKVEKPYGGKRYMTISEFAKSTKGTRTKYIVSVPHHLVFVKNGKYYDAWDSGKETVRKILQ